jgi:RNA polymerase sigma factor (sigma-70 family)
MGATAVRPRERGPARVWPVVDESDGALVARLRAGDDDAFEAIYDRYHRGLLAFCRHMLGGRHDAEDALQLSLVSAYRALRNGSDGDIDLKPWLYTIARNRCLSMLRARRDEPVGHDLAEDGRAFHGLADEVQRRSDLRDLVEELQRLPEDQRAALVLFELGDHSHDEIGAVLGVRKAKVKALVFQAREALLRAQRARDTPCGEIREQIASVTGRVPRRSALRAHLDRCGPCSAFELEVRRQRAALAAVLPVAPTLGLKASVLGSAFGGGATTSGGTAVAGGAAASGATTASGGGVATAGATGATAAGGVGGAGGAAAAGSTATAGALTGAAGLSAVTVGGVAGGVASAGAGSTVAGLGGLAVPGVVAKVVTAGLAIVVAGAGGAGYVGTHARHPGEAHTPAVNQSVTQPTASAPTPHAGLAAIPPLFGTPAAAGPVAATSATAAPSGAAATSPATTATPGATSTTAPTSSTPGSTSPQTTRPPTDTGPPPATSSPAPAATTPAKTPPTANHPPSHSTSTTKHPPAGAAPVTPKGPAVATTPATPKHPGAGSAPTTPKQPRAGSAPTTPKQSRAGSAPPTPRQPPAGSAPPTPREPRAGGAPTTPKQPPAGSAPTTPKHPPTGDTPHRSPGTASAPATDRSLTSTVTVDARATMRSDPLDSSGTAPAP